MITPNKQSFSLVSEIEILIDMSFLHQYVFLLKKGRFFGKYMMISEMYFKREQEGNELWFWVFEHENDNVYAFMCVYDL